MAERSIEKWFFFLSVIALAVLAVAESGRAAESRPSSIRLLQGESLQRVPVDPNPTGIPERVPFKILEGKFDKAKGVQLDELKGWLSGRCYFPDAPATPIASILVADGGAESKAHGPAFSTSADRTVVPLVNTSGPADYFDRLDERASAVIRKRIADSKDKVSFPVRSNETLVIAGLRTADLESRQYLLRRSGAFVQLRMTCSENSYCMNGRVGASGGRVLAYEAETTAACYYFKRVK